MKEVTNVKEEMTLDEIKAIANDDINKEVIRKKAEALCIHYNSAISEENYRLAREIEVEIDNAVKGYNERSRLDTFEEIRTTEDPMLEAVKRRTYPTIRAKDVRHDDITVREIEDTTKPIDLLKLHNSKTGGIGKDKTWRYKVEKFNLLLTLHRAVELGITTKREIEDISNSYAMSDMAKKLEMGKTPTSKTQILKALEEVITSMIGEEYKPTSHDVNYLLSIYARKSRKELTVAVANHRYLRNYIAEICHRIVLDKNYAVEYKKATNNR